MSLGIFAEKMGMSHVFTEKGKRIPVTLLKLKECKVIDHKTKEKNGYDAIVIGFDEVKEKKLNNPQIVYFKNKGLSLFKYIREFRNDLTLDISVNLPVDQIFSDVKFVDITSVGKGKGFAGVIKRHNFGGLRASHGVSISHRSHGSTGNMRKQGKVFKGKKMAGHLGDKQVTVQNLKVVKLDLENNLFIVQGAVPGCVGTLTKIKPAIKKLSQIVQNN